MTRVFATGSTPCGVLAGDRQPSGAAVAVKASPSRERARGRGGRKAAGR